VVCICVRCSDNAAVKLVAAARADHPVALWRRISAYD
jgi:hypothetical protein